VSDHSYVESGSGFCARCDDMPGEGVHALPPKQCTHEDMACPPGECEDLYPPFREDMGR
jgi:hypothetical protein